AAGPALGGELRTVAAGERVDGAFGLVSGCLADLLGSSSDLLGLTADAGDLRSRTLRESVALVERLELGQGTFHPRLGLADAVGGRRLTSNAWCAALDLARRLRQRSGGADPALALLDHLADAVDLEGEAVDLLAGALDGR